MGGWHYKAVPSTALLAILQLVFALTWVVYVIYLPALAAQAGIDKRYVPWILMMDQAIFVACDWAAGVLADRVAGAIGKLGKQIAFVTLVSCFAFLAMPWVAPQLGAPVFIALTVLWSVTSSALRAPPFVLFSRRSSQPRQAWVAGTYLLGFGLAAAMAPFLGSALKTIDPRIPFAAASIVLAVVTLVLARAEASGPPLKPSAPSPVRARGAVPRSMLWFFAFGVLLFGLGFQVHFSLNSAPAYLKFATPADLERLMPLFWVGFNVAILPATLLTKRLGGIGIMALGGFAGVMALAGARLATDLQMLSVMQVLGGAAWSVVLMSAFTAAIETGHVGREGLVTGLLFSMLAAAAFLRISTAVVDVGTKAEIATWLPYAPLFAWTGASFVAAWLATRLKS